MQMDLNNDVIYEIYRNSGLFTRAKAAMHDSRILRWFPHTPPLNQEHYEKIQYYIDHHDQVTEPLELIAAINLMALYKIELNVTVKIYSQKIANLIKGKTIDQIRAMFNK